MTEFATALRAGRGRLGISQAEAAERLGVTRVAYSLWERDKTIPEPHNLIGIADLFGREVADLAPDPKPRGVGPAKLRDEVEAVRLGAELEREDLRRTLDVLRAEVEQLRKKVDAGLGEDQPSRKRPPRRAKGREPHD